MQCFSYIIEQVATKLHPKQYNKKSLETLYGLVGTTKHKIIVEIYKSLLGDKVSPLWTPEEAAELTKCEIENFKTTTKRLYRDSILDRTGFNSTTGGSVYWFHPKIQKCLDDIKIHDPNYLETLV